MITKNQKDIIGSLKISEEVIATIANIAASDIEGVASVADSGKIKDVFNFKKNSQSKSIKIDINDIPTIDIYINVEHNAKIQEVSQKVQQKVKEDIQSMTGIIISKVNVHIVSIDFNDIHKSDD